MLACDVMLANKIKFREQGTMSNAHAVFFDNSFSSTLPCELRVHRAGSRLKIAALSIIYFILNE